MDLDGTLVRTDTLLEALLAAVRANPWQVLRLPFLLLRGRAALKKALLGDGAVDPALLPYREALVEYLRAQMAAGRELVLATATDRACADGVAEHLGIFDDVLASDGDTNLKGATKAQALVDRFGEKGFVYAGDAAADVPVFERAGGAILVGGATRLKRRLPDDVGVEAEFPSAGGRPRALLKALRPYQWAKNTLVFVPALAAHVLDAGATGLAALLAFAAFCCTASGIYVVNDLLDLEDDRRHPRKRGRPFAAGALPLTYGWIGPALVAGGLVLGWIVSPATAAMVLVYAVLSTTYSVYLKTRPLVDIFTLAALYMLRILTGGVATDIHVSIWLLGFSSFLFLALACLKRTAELQDAAEDLDATASRRGYLPVDLPMVRLMGVASTFASAVVLSLYVEESRIAAEIYEASDVLWLIVPLLLFWQCRLWLSAGRGWMHDDPLVFALKDRISWLVVACVAAVFLIASYGWPGG